MLAEKRLPWQVRWVHAEEDDALEPPRVMLISPALALDHPQPPSLQSCADAIISQTQVFLKELDMLLWVQCNRRPVSEFRCLI